jgi:hypothetical protein
MFFPVIYFVWFVPPNDLLPKYVTELNLMNRLSKFYQSVLEGAYGN